MRNIRVVLLALLLAVFAPAADRASDDEIYDKVRIMLANDSTVKGAAIDVKVAQGTVELIGKVRTEKQKERAERVAKKVKGVQRVVNNLKVSPV
jgi:osmotically-inducible protein OsmY